MEHVLAIIQAAMDSSHLPGTLLKELQGRALLEHVVDRVNSCRQIRHTVVATSNHARDLPIVEFCQSHSIPVFRGSERDLLDRFFHVASKFKPQHIVRIHGDRPLLDPNVVGRLITKYSIEKLDYCAIPTPATKFPGQEKMLFPAGLEGEIFSALALEEAWCEAESANQRENITPYIWEDAKKFKIATLGSPYAHGHYRFTIESADDLAAMEAIYRDLSPQSHHLDYLAVIAYVEKNREILARHKKNPLEVVRAVNIH
jgi:spore coat polysaccharide biosynthesis protein SpsF